MDCKCCKTWLLGLVLLGKLIVVQLINKLLCFTEQEVAYCVHKCPPQVLNQNNTVHSLPRYSFQYPFIVIFQTTSRSPNLFFFSGFSDPHFVCISHLSHEGYIVCPPPFVYLVKLTRVQLKFPHFILISIILQHTLSLVEIFSSTLFSHPLILLLSYKTRVHISHQYKMTGIIVVSYLFIFAFQVQTRCNELSL